MSERKTARTKYDPRTHATMDTGWQTLSLCGRRITWLNGQEPIDPGAGVVDCEACLEIMREASVTNLAEFLLARLAEDEALALKQPETDVSRWAHYLIWARFSRARVLAEVATKRRIVEEHRPSKPPWPTKMEKGCRTCSTAQTWDATAYEANCLTLRLLAQPFADHPDFDPAWKVEP